MPEGQSYLELAVNALKHPFGGTGVIPGTRAIISGTPATLTVNGGASATLGAGDITLALVVSGGGSALVGAGRTLAATSPLRIDGGASADLSANRTFSVLTFGAANSGVVPQTGGVGAGYFCDALGNWVLGTVAGVSSITGTAPIVASAATGAVTLSISAANLTTPGYVPAVGAVELTKFLRKNNPPDWAVPGTGSFVTLQPSYPGTPDAGNAHITGTFGAQVGLVVGDSQTRSGWGLGNVYFKQASPTSHPTVVSIYSLGGPINAGMTFLAARGSVGTPADTATLDQLFSLNVGAWLTSGFDTREILSVIHEGSSSSHVPMSVMLRSWDSGVSSAYLYLKGNSLAGLNTTTPLSGFDVATSLGLSAQTLTGASPSIASPDDDCVYYCDATAADQTITLGTPSGRSRRIVMLTKIDATSNYVNITVTGGLLIGGFPNFYLLRMGDCIIIQSDGSNYQVLSQSVSAERSTLSADSAELASSVAETTLWDNGETGFGLLGGMTSRFSASGKFSTTGTPTLRFKLKNPNDETILDSGTVTMPNGVTDATWQLEAYTTHRVADATSARFMSGKLWIGQTAGQGAEMKCYNLIDIGLGGMSAYVVPRKITAQWGTSSASNKCTLLAASVNVVRQTALV